MILKLGTEAAAVLRSAVQYRISPLAAARIYWHLYRGRQFSPSEIHFFGLLNPVANRDAVVSKEELLGVQRRLNPAEHHRLTEDKLVFYARCQESSLPTPAIHAVVGAGERWARLRRIESAAELESFLSAAEVDQFMLKPVDGVHGKGVMRLKREGPVWSSAGEALHAAQLFGRMRDGEFRCWMFQEFVPGHSDLNRLSDTEALQTVRVVTYVEPGGRVDVLAARLRLICGDHAHDNFDFGRTGNLIAILDTNRGAITRVVGGSGTPLRLCEVTRHPRTKRNLIGYEVPMWAEVRGLAIVAAKSFLPLRTVGWDVAITDSGTSLIEGNVTWDTLSGDARMGDIYRRLAVGH